MAAVKVDKEILRNRLSQLDWTAYELAKKVSQVRAEEFGEEVKAPSALVSSVSKTLDNPNTSSWKNVEAVIKAMGGEILIRWPKTEQVVTGYEDVKL